MRPRADAVRAAAWRRLWHGLLRDLDDQDDLVRDDDLDATQRDYLREFTTPRRALDGSVVWLVGEVEQ